MALILGTSLGIGWVLTHFSLYEDVAESRDWLGDMDVEADVY